MADVIVVRHGETISEPGICIGRINVPLSERGRKRADILGSFLKEKYPGIGRIIPSPLDRAVDTAEAIAKFYEIMPETDENVTEIDLGEWEGKHFDKIREEDPPAFVKRGEDPWDYRITKAETFHEASLRFQKRIKEYAKDEKDVLVVAHKGVITGLFAELGYADKKDLFHVSCPNLSISVFRMHDEQLQVADGLYRPLALLDDVLIENLYQRHKTPSNVIAHMKAVADYAMKILDDLHSNYEREKIYKAALLHDLDRTKKHHAKVAAESLRKEGFTDIADIVEVHHREEYKKDAPVCEADILWYADKCILEDRVVSIEERFSVSRKNALTRKLCYIISSDMRKHVISETKSNRRAEMKLVKTKEAVGMMLCHDMTQIIPGEFKGPLFRKGHIITEEDIPLLLSIGKDHIYVWEVNENMLHEDEAAEILCQICTGNSSMFDSSSVKEGKIEVIAACDGLLKIDRKRLYAVNALGEMMIASRHGDTAVKKGDKIAGTRVIPLVIEKEKMVEAQQVSAGAPIFTLKPFVKKRIGLVTTGNEVYYGRIEDKYIPVIKAKLKAFGAEVVSHHLSTDDVDMVAGLINTIYDEGVDMIICTGGMSVDPDDRTPAAIRAAVDEVITYGAPVLPGAMFMLGYKGEKKIPVCGLPGCVTYAKRTIFDLMLPRLLADDPGTKEEIDRLGEGGLCLNCDICTFPNCGFGK